MMRLFRTSERGAVLVHTGFTLLGLLAFSAFSVDYGVLWVGRRQAQNAADAAALAGAISLAYGDSNDLARARSVAVAAGQANEVWGVAPSIGVGDITIAPCPAGTPGLPDQCVRADVYRNQARGNPLPTFFARLVGVNNQGVRATATAQILNGSSVNCTRPWALPNKWNENREGEPPVADDLWEWDDEFERYFEKGKNKGQLLPVNPPPAPRDTAAGYHDPASPLYDPAYGFRNAGIIGEQVQLKIGDSGDRIAAGNFYAIEIPGVGPGGSNYRDNIATCNPAALPINIGDYVTTEPGNMVGPTRQGVSDLIAQDPGAYWDGSGIAGSCAPGCAPTSPRIVPVVVFNIETYYQSMFDGAHSTGRYDLLVEDLICFFVEPMPNGAKDVMGRFMPCAVSNNDPAGANASPFLRRVILVR
jgi:Flp pilus assembly protein TadG